MTFTPKELEIISLGLELYKAKLKKVMKDTDAVKAGEKDVKQTFFETERIIQKVNQDL